ncbi:MAG: hydantoinase/oxoprolinase family protein [Variibacter sp.]
MIVGVDIGGTFTDVVCADQREGNAFFAKTPTNYQSIVSSVVTGIRKLLRDQGGSEADIEHIVHGTTIATNVVVQRAGVTVALFASDGFEDVLEIGRLKRRRMYDLQIDAQTPVFLAEKQFRFGIKGRIGSAGEVLDELDEESVLRAVKKARALGVTAIAVSYLFSFKNPAHELRTREIIQAVAPEISVSLSCEVDPVYREYERTVVTAFDAYMRPKVELFMNNLEHELERAGFDTQVYIMQSRGGMVTSRIASQRPVLLFLSGPAGGLLGATKIARSVGSADLITMDIGGTSCDVSLVHRGELSITSTGEIAGYPVRLPMVDTNTIGAGGGSILWADKSGMLRVGPRSAGSDPGPACYGRGGTEPTITDASLVLGYLSPKAFAGGAFDLDVDSAKAAIDALARKTGLTPVEVALGAHRIMNFQIAEQIRSMTIRRGHDLRQLALLPFGGAGPIHGGATMSILGMTRCIIPSVPGVLSAYGLLHADFEIEEVTSVLLPFDGVDHADLRQRLAALREHCFSVAEGEGIETGDLLVAYSADVRYIGQSYEITVPLTSAEVDGDVLKALQQDYEDRYRRIYGFSHRSRAEIVNLRARAYKSVASLDKLNFPQLVPSGRAAESRHRPAWFLGSEKPVETAIYARPDLAVGAPVKGPAIIEQLDTTVVVYPGQSAVLDASNNIIISGISEAYVR